jgi:predicted TIM-barrel fold metal-dependent hydrolase
MVTAIRTKRIDVDTHFLPRLDFEQIRDLLPGDLSPQTRDMLARDGLRFADPRGFRAALKGAATSPAPEDDPHRDPLARVKAMDELGFDMHVLVPDGMFMNLYGGAPLGGNMPFEVRYALCQLYNNGVAEAQRRFPDRYATAAIIPFDNMEASCREAERAVTTLGARAIVVPPNWLDKNFDTLELYPFWEMVNALDVALCVHQVPQGCSGTIVDHAPRYPMVGMERMRRLHIGTYMGFGMEYMLACAALTLGGVLDEFPHLRFCFFEAGASWMPYAMYSCDRSFMIEPQCSRTRTLPSELIKRHCYTAVEPMEYIPGLIGAVGNENFFFGTDFPHPEFDTFHSTATAIQGRDDLTEEDKANILGANIARALKIT